MSPTNCLDPEPPGSDVALMVTRRCNMSCDHCSVESGPAVRGEPTETELLDWLRQVAAAGVRSIRLTGGEPMLRVPTVLRLLRESRRLGLATALTTNAFWGRSPAHARRHLRALRRAGLGSLTVSYDRYHADFQGADPILHIARAAEAGHAVPLRISLVRGTDEPELTAIAARLDGARGTNLRFYDLQPVGRARQLPLELHRGEVEGFCTACSAPAITDDGRVIACNGPAYFEEAGSPLVLGSLRDASFAELLDRHRRDPILDAIRTLGPAGLRDELRQIPGFERFPFRSQYLGICDLCHHITRSDDAVAALRARLGGSQATAMRLARWQVIDGNRKHGELSVGHVNGVGACRVLLRGALEPNTNLGSEAEHILGRADLDWRRLADYASGSGLARPLLPMLDRPDMMRWAPQFFRQALRTRALADGLRELVQRDAIRQIADGLRELGARGVLLKGTAFLLREPGGFVPRATSDVDIVVDPAVAGPLRARLIRAGFEGSTVGATTFQHLAPIVCQGVAVEIHTRIMPSFWGLPEREILADARPVPGSDVLFTFGPEGLALHAGVHASASFFSFGLKTAWDLLAIARSRTPLDWERLAAWVAMSRAPRGFWAPVRVLADELGLPLPAAFLRHAPTDAGARRVETIARHRLFRAMEGLFDLDVLTKSALMLLIQDDWRGRAGYLGATLQWRGGRPSTWRAAAGRARRADVFGQAWRHYRQYRRAVGRARATSREPTTGWP